MTPTKFKEEQELSEILAGWASQHDCVEAGCTLNPDFEAIPPGKPKKRKRTGLARAKVLWKTHRKGELK